MTPAQGERLWEAAAAVRPGGTIAEEYGSYRGKSAIVMASAAADGVTVTDPHAGNDRGRRSRDRGRRPVRPRRLPRQPGRGRRQRPGSPRPGLLPRGAGRRARGPRRPLHRRRASCRPGPRRHRLVGGQGGAGGTLLIDDSFQLGGRDVGPPDHLVPGGRFRYLGRDGSLARYQREDLAGTARIAKRQPAGRGSRFVRPQRGDQGAAAGPPRVGGPHAWPRRRDLAVLIHPRTVTAGGRRCGSLTLSRPGPAGSAPARAASSSPLGRSPAVKGSGPAAAALWSSSS